MSMNLNALANRIATTVNPNIWATWQQSQVPTVLASGKTTPNYAAGLAIIVQAQELTIADLKHVEAMNLGTVERAVYANAQLGATDRLAQTGGDLLTFEGAVWLVVAILEGWTTAGWCKAGLVRQLDTPA